MKNENIQNLINDFLLYLSMEKRDSKNFKHGKKRFKKYYNFL